MPIVIDSRGVSVYVTDDEARAQAAELASRAEQALDIADARGWSLNASDAQRVQHDLDEAAKLLEEIGEYKQLSGPVDLARFYAPGESEAILAERAAAEERRREQTTRMAAAYRLFEELGEEESDSVNVPRRAPYEAPAADLVNTPSERVNVKRIDDAAGALYVVSGRGETKKYATLEVAEREARRRATGRA